ncbi:MAG TPA: acyl-CoA desaturase [Kofleriaceae bacterium]|nr:acyl-CoA desaturase [Kofleriaceae bacterium]
MSTEPYRALQALVKQRDFEDLKAARGFFELALILIMTLGGLALCLLSDQLVVQIAALLISTCGCLGMSTSAHTSSHYCTSNSRPLNRFLTFFGFPFFFGVSATYWWHKHCVVHHPVPNLIGEDDDIDLSPFFAITESGDGRTRRLFYRLQWLLVPLALALNEFNIQRSGWLFLTKRLRDPKQRRPIHWLDLGTLALHWATWVFVPMLFFSPLSVIGFYALRMALMGFAMFVGFAPAHFPAEAVAAVSTEKSADFILRQTATTVNFRTGPLGALLCGGVEYQIEHHLFPSISPRHYPELSKIVEAYCREHGYPYRTLGWWEATWKSLVVFYRPKRVLPRLADCMEKPAASPAAPLLTAEAATGAVAR